MALCANQNIPIQSTSGYLVWFFKPEVSWSLGLLTSSWVWLLRLLLLLLSPHPLQLQRRPGVLPQLSAAGTRFAAVERLMLIHPLVGVCWRYWWRMSVGCFVWTCLMRKMLSSCGRVCGSTCRGHGHTGLFRGPCRWSHYRPQKCWRCRRGGQSDTPSRFEYRSLFGTPGKPRKATDIGMRNHSFSLIRVSSYKGH